MKTVLLYGEKAAGRVALVDDEDYELVMQYRWNVWERVMPSGELCGPYAIANLPRRGARRPPIKMHKLITGYALTDHANHNGLDNRRENLRPAGGRQNVYNARKLKARSSRYKGVTWDAGRNRWMAKIMANRKTINLGRFDDEVSAALAYDFAARQIAGEYACLNFPDP